jgi:hypothetical protein
MLTIIKRTSQSLLRKTIEGEDRLKYDIQNHDIPAVITNHTNIAFQSTSEKLIGVNCCRCTIVSAFPFGHSPSYVGAWKIPDFLCYVVFSMYVYAYMSALSSKGQGKQKWIRESPTL